MAQHETKSAIDFSAYIADRTHDSTGREWVFAALTGSWGQSIDTGYGENDHACA